MPPAFAAALKLAHINWDAQICPKDWPHALHPSTPQDILPSK